MCPLEEAFWKAIHDNPYNRAERLVYADWLEEHGRDRDAHYWRTIIVHKPIMTSLENPAHTVFPNHGAGYSGDEIGNGWGDSYMGDWEGDGKGCGRDNGDIYIEEEEDGDGWGCGLNQPFYGGLKGDGGPGRCL